MQIGPRIRFDKHTLGNLVKNLSPALAFTPLGPLGAAGASALGDVARGKHNIGGILRGALTNATIGTAAKAGYGAIRGAMNGAPQVAAAGAPAPVAPTVAGPGPLSAAASGTPPLAPISAGVGGVPASVTSAATAAPSSPGIVRSALSFAEKNPTAVGMGLQGLGQIATAGSENRLQNAQAGALEQQGALTAEQQQRRKALDDWFAAHPLTLDRPPVADSPYTLAGR